MTLSLDLQPDSAAETLFRMRLADLSLPCHHCFAYTSDVLTEVLLVDPIEREMYLPIPLPLSNRLDITICPLSTLART